MRYASVEGERREAEPKLRGICPNCNGVVVAKCGQRRIRHWAHLGKLECDHWWESETEWHRAWKSLFPPEWQEVVHRADDGERHIADVKNDRGWVIELQHSPITPDERLSREKFYEPMDWVVDGMRYKRDIAAFREAVAEYNIVSDNPLLLAPLTRAGIFLRWAPLKRRVFIDFGNEEFSIAGFPPPEPVLWLLEPARDPSRVLIVPVTRASFIQFVIDGSALQHLAVTRPPPPPIRSYRGGRTRYLLGARPRRRF